MFEIKSRFHKSENWRFPVGTICLTALVLSVYVLHEMVYNEQDITWLGFWPERFFISHDLSTVGSEYFSLFSYAFVHKDTMHFALNAMGLLYFGILVERYLGASRLLIIFLAGALASALSFGLVHFYVLDEAHVALIGASGSISAFVGVAAHLRKIIPVLFWLIAEAAMIVATVAVVIIPPQPIGYIVHLTGFAVGASLARLVLMPATTTKKQQQRGSLPAQKRALLSHDWQWQ